MWTKPTAGQADKTHRRMTGGGSDVMAGTYDLSRPAGNVVGMGDTFSMDVSERSAMWASTMRGHEVDDAVVAHGDSSASLHRSQSVLREVRESIERETLSQGAALAQGAGKRAVPEEPDLFRTCFERDRDRIVHSSAFRRLAGKTQVVVYPRDHQRTRLTHALEVAQVATAIARGVGANATLADTIALGHDCGHGPGGHASEDAFDPYIPGGYHHGPWGADVSLRHLNLCEETLDGIRNHSWSQPAPFTVEGEIVSWADRIAYCAHDLEDAIHVGILSVDDLPDSIVRVCGHQRAQQLRVFVRAVIDSTIREGKICMDAETAAALAELRKFTFERIYMRPDSVAQSQAMIQLLRALVDHFIAHPDLVPNYEDPYRWPPQGFEGIDDKCWRAVEYVAGMTDRFACEQAATFLNYDLSTIPPGLGRGI